MNMATQLKPKAGGLDGAVLEQIRRIHRKRRRATDRWLRKFNERQVR